MAPEKGGASLSPCPSYGRMKKPLTFSSLGGDVERSSWMALLATVAGSSVMKMPGQK